MCCLSEHLSWYPKWNLTFISRILHESPGLSHKCYSWKAFAFASLHLRRNNQERALTPVGPERPYYYISVGKTPLIDHPSKIKLNKISCDGLLLSDPTETYSDQKAFIFAKYYLNSHLSVNFTRHMDSLNFNTVLTYWRLIGLLTTEDFHWEFGGGDLKPYWLLINREEIPKYLFYKFNYILKCIWCVSMIAHQYQNEVFLIKIK